MFKLVKFVFYVALIVALGAGIMFFVNVDTENEDYTYEVEYDIPSDILEKREATIKDLTNRIETGEYGEDQTLYDMHYSLGVQYASIGKLGQAVYHYRKASEENTQAHMPLDSIGVTYEEMKDFIKAEQAYTQALDVFPHAYSVYEHLIGLYRKMGVDTERIKGVYEDAVENIAVVVTGSDVKEVYNNEKVVLDKTNFHCQVRICDRDVDLKYF